MQGTKPGNGSYVLSGQVLYISIDDQY